MWKHHFFYLKNADINVNDKLPLAQKFGNNGSLVQ